MNPIEKDTKEQFNLKSGIILDFFSNTFSDFDGTLQVCYPELILAIFMIIETVAL